MPNWTCGECGRSVFGLKQHRCVDDVGNPVGKDVPNDPMVEERQVTIEEVHDMIDRLFKGEEN